MESFPIDEGLIDSLQPTNSKKYYELSMQPTEKNKTKSVIQDDKCNNKKGLMNKWTSFFFQRNV